MEFKNLAYPIEANVQTFAHFMGKDGKYIFTFASPYSYSEPADLKAKKAFLLGDFDIFHKSTVPETLYAWYTLGEEHRNAPCRKGTALRRNEFFDGDGSPLGYMDVVVPTGFIRRYDGRMPNLVYDTAGKADAFCLYQPMKKQKSLFTFTEWFDELREPMDAKQTELFEQEGKITRVYTYDLVHLQTDIRSAMEALFSNSKKSENVNNRVQCFSEPENPQTCKRWLLALFSFFWTTYVDSPLA